MTGSGWSTSTLCTTPAARTRRRRPQACVWSAAQPFRQQLEPGDPAALHQHRVALAQRTERIDGCVGVRDHQSLVLRRVDRDHLDAELLGVVSDAAMFEV